jgi:hypothetical protein
MPDIKAAVVAAAEETSPTTSTDVLMLINAAGTTFKKIKLVTLFEAVDALQYKGVLDCSANPNYPAANAGHVYKVSVAGKIGGASGPNVEVGDTLTCAVDSSTAADHATVGANWGIVQANVPFSSFILTLLDDVDAAAARTTLGLGNVDNTSDATKNAASVTLTNKRITTRIVTEASNATPTPNADTTDEHTITALAAAAAFQAPSGTPTEGQPMIIRIKDNGTARALSFDGIYRAIGVTLPTTTVLSKTMYIGMIYNLTDTKWDVLAVSEEA